MAMILGRITLIVCLLHLTLGAALAQEEPPPPQEEPQEEAFVPPTPRGEVTILTPEEAPEHEAPVVVTVVILVDEEGLVAQTTLVSTTHPELQVFVDAVLQQGTAFEFEPATYQGAPVRVEIEFTHTFLPPEPEEVIPEELVEVLPEEPVDQPRAFIIGRLEEKGTRKAIERATVIGRWGEEQVTTTTDEEGVFVLEVAPGEVEVEIFAPEHKRFLQQETVAEDEALKIGYLLERKSYNPYEIVVYGEAERSEVSRTTLTGKEIKRIPGTFGDPFRVVQSLPGVASIVSLIPFPVVRGSSPSSTGFLIDGVRVPLLFHLLAGPSVINPEFIDEIRFYPGGFPLEYGRYTGGIVDGRTRPLYTEDFSADIDVNLLQAGGLVRIPTPWFTATVAGRYGYPGGLISLVTDEISLQYWDYQVRIDGGDPSSSWTIFAFGAGDELETLPAPTEENPNPTELETAARFMFHRLDLRYTHRGEDLDGRYQLVFGVDDTLAGPGADLVNFYIEPRLQWNWRIVESLGLHFGVDANTRFIGDIVPQDTGAVDTSDELRALLGSDNLTNAGAFVEVRWELLEELIITPGIRSDLYNDGITTVVGVDPRLLIRWSPATLDWGLEDEDTTEMALAERSPIWLKAGVGLYHQPPRFLVPLPGLDQIALEAGLLEAVQSQVGVEVPLPEGLSIDATVFFNSMDPMIFDLAVNPAAIDLQLLGPGSLPGELPEPDDESLVDQIADTLLSPTVGRSYGLELLIRRQSPNGIYGWIAYTLSRSERLQDDGTWAPFDYDRTHILNLVLGIPLPRNWDISFRFQMQSGRPASTTGGFNVARNDPILRFDVRIDKRAVWNDWLLDFYIDITNATLFPEEVAAGAEFSYVLPTLGLRAVF